MSIDTAPGGSWLILCDFDGTVTDLDVVDGLLERFAEPGWRDIEERWTRGQIGSAECLSGQAALLDASPEALGAWLDTVAVDPGFRPFLAAAAARGHEVHIVSDGFDLAIGRILARHGVQGIPFHANRLRPAAAPGRWQLTSPHAEEGCSSGTCKCAIAERTGGGAARPCLLIGDGRSDFCVAAHADLVFAKGKLAGHCLRRGLLHVPIAGFADVLPLLPMLDQLASHVSPKALP